MIETRNITRDKFRNYELGVFNIQEEHVDLLTQWLTRWAASYSAGKLFRIVCPLAWNYTIIRDREAGFDPPLLDTVTDVLVIEGYWQSFKYFDPYQDIIRSELTFRKAPSEKNRRIIDEIESVEAIAVHVRRGDYVTNTNNNASLGTCSLEYYRKADTYIGRHVKKPHYYIFTDDAEWARDNLTFFLGPTRVVDHNSGKADSEDFRLMTHCKHFIIANSSFSWWGAWLAPHSEKIIIAPKEWFTVDNFPPEDRIPESWLRF
jgi:hypothetical protein